MIKRITSILLIGMLIFTQLAVFAEPSEWATEFVENASKDELIPDSLKSDYQNNIKRYEYVLLALKILDQNSVEVEIKEESPFSDISGHLFETEIIKAYNAGIVGGYDDKTFRPDNEIKREEVAALVYNLVHKINENQILPTSESAFSDSSEISNWAKPFIEFNYVNKIMSGTGKQNNLDTINPKGKTSREEAITLLYKVSFDEDLLDVKEYVAIESVQNGNVDQNVVKKINKNFGEESIDSVLELNQSDDNKIQIAVENNVYLVSDDGASIALSYSGSSDIYNVDMILTDLERIDLIESYKKMLRQRTYGNSFADKLDIIIDKMQDVNYEYHEMITPDALIDCYVVEDNGEKMYMFWYRE